MAQAPIELQIGGQSYRLIASAEEAELRHLAAMVEQRLREVAGPSRTMSAQNLLLVALKLAHELEEEQRRRTEGELRAKSTLRTLLERIDAVLDESPLPPPVASSESASKPCP